MDWTFEKVIKILEGYFNFLCLFLPSHDIKIEKTEATENTLLIAISNTITKLKYVDCDLDKPMEENRMKITYTLSLVVDKQIIKEDNNEIEPK